MNSKNRTWGELTGGCRVSIVRLPSDETEHGIVTLALMFRNDSSATVLFPRSSLWFDYDFSVLTESGIAVPLTAFGKQQRESLGVAAATVAEVATGKEYETTVELSRLYQLGEPGSYTVQAFKAFRDPSSRRLCTRNLAPH